MEHAIVLDGLAQAAPDAGQLGRQTAVDRRHGRGAAGLGIEDRIERQRIRKIQPLPKPFAEIVFRHRHFRAGVGQNADEGGAIEGGALQSTRHDHVQIRHRKGTQGYYIFAIRSAPSVKPCASNDPLG